ncbi:MAG: AsmA-like C-terminal region-containing protein, partial [Pseudomonadota bacterium]
KAEKGSFVQLKEGAGRLVGILDLTSILRVLTLDLNPIFGRGFVYENVEGHVTLDGGNAYTRDLKLKGTVARVSVDGRVGLAKEDFDLRIVIDPQFSGTVATGTWALFGPAAAAAV